MNLFTEIEKLNDIYLPISFINATDNLSNYKKGDYLCEINLPNRNLNYNQFVNLFAETGNLKSDLLRSGLEIISEFLEFYDNPSDDERGDLLFWLSMIITSLSKYIKESTEFSFENIEEILNYDFKDENLRVGDLKNELKAEIELFTGHYAKFFRSSNIRSAKKKVTDAKIFLSYLCVFYTFVEKDIEKLAMLNYEKLTNRHPTKL